MMKLAGHKNPNITMRIYTHVNMESKREAMDAMQAAYVAAGQNRLGLAKCHIPKESIPALRRSSQRWDYLSELGSANQDFASTM